MRSNKVRNGAKSDAWHRYQAFVTAYLGGDERYPEARFNGTQAAIAAGYSPKTAYAAANRLLKTAEVQRLLGEQVEAALTAARVTVEQTVLEYARIAYLDPRALFDVEGRLRDVTDMPEELARAISSLEVEENEGAKARTMKLRLHSKIAALDSLARYLKMWCDHVEATINDPARVLEKGHERARRMRKRACEDAG